MEFCYKSCMQAEVYIIRIRFRCMAAVVISGLNLIISFTSARSWLDDLHPIYKQMVETAWKKVLSVLSYQCGTLKLIYWQYYCWLYNRSVTVAFETIRRYGQHFFCLSNHRLSDPAQEHAASTRLSRFWKTIGAVKPCKYWTMMYAIWQRFVQKYGYIVRFVLSYRY